MGCLKGLPASLTTAALKSRGCIPIGPRHLAYVVRVTLSWDICKKRWII